VAHHRFQGADIVRELVWGLKHAPDSSMICGAVHTKIALLHRLRRRLSQRPDLAPVEPFKQG
jgi:hypothetical protein